MDDFKEQITNKKNEIKRKIIWNDKKAAKNIKIGKIRKPKSWQQQQNSFFKIEAFCYLLFLLGFEFFTAASKQAMKQSKQPAAVVKIFILMPQQINQSNVRYNIIL